MAQTYVSKKWKTATCHPVAVKNILNIYIIFDLWKRAEYLPLNSITETYNSKTSCCKNIFGKVYSNGYSTISGKQHVECKLKTISHLLAQNIFFPNGLGQRIQPRDIGLKCRLARL